MPILKPYLLLDDINSELECPLLGDDEQMDSDDTILVDSMHGASNHRTTVLGATPTDGTTHKQNGATASNTDHKNDTRHATTPPNAETRVRVGSPQRQVSEEEVTFFNRYDIETEETMKCIVTSVMFAAIIIAIIVVAFVVNPQV